jgi:DNA-binding transcriptional ArsR family regulator
MLACLGDQSRFKVVRELSRGERCVTELASRIGLSQSCTTRHLQALEREGLVESVRLGKRVVFSVARDPWVAALVEWAIPECSRGGAESVTRANSSARVEESAKSVNELENNALDDTARARDDLEDYLL